MTAGEKMRRKRRIELSGRRWTVWASTARQRPRWYAWKPAGEDARSYAVAMRVVAQGTVP